MPWTKVQLPSQSHSTDQGTSDGLVAGPLPVMTADSLNPTVQIRAVPTWPWSTWASCCCNGLSQSHSTDQGSSDDDIGVMATPAAFQSQSHSTDQGSSDYVLTQDVFFAVKESQSHSTDQGSSDDGFDHDSSFGDLRVSIPQYRSGQFRRFRSGGGQGPGRRREVSIPQYRSGQFRQWRLYLILNQWVRGPISVTSSRRLRRRAGEAVGEHGIWRLSHWGSWG